MLSSFYMLNEFYPFYAPTNLISLIAGCGYPKTISFQHYTDEVQNYLEADAVPLLVSPIFVSYTSVCSCVWTPMIADCCYSNNYQDEQQTIKAAPSERTSSKARIKALMTEEMSARSQLQRASSINELGYSDNLRGIASGWPNPIIILERSADTTASRLHVPSLPNGEFCFFIIFSFLL